MQSPSDAYLGTQPLTSPGSDYNAIDFMVRQIMGGMATAQLVKVMEVDAPGGVAMAGRVKVQIMVNQVTGAGDAVDGGVIYDVPYVRMQGGSSAIILDPEVDDIGLCVFACADITAVKANRDTSNPGSNRRFSYSDGLYFGGFLNALPIQYFLFGAEGIKVVSPVKVRIEAPLTEVVSTTTFTGPVTINGAFTVTGATSITGTTAITGATTVTGSLTSTALIKGLTGEFGAGTLFVKLSDNSNALALKSS